MSEKFVANSVLGVAVAGALIAGMVGCSGNANQDGSISPANESLSATDLGSNLYGGGYGGGDTPSCSHGVSDPGVRGGPPGAGTPIANLNDHELAFFNDGILRVTEVESTCDTCNDIPINDPIPPGSPPDTTNSAGLGATFNDVRCALGCHSQPTIGGTSPASNPAFFSAHTKGSTNKIFFFDTPDGPTREVRFLFNPDGTRDGGVHQKFTAQGRSDAPLCTLKQPDFDTEYANGNLGFRIPLALFGLGLMDSIQDVEILAHKNSNLARKAELGIQGATNNNGNTGAINRFGWKAQNNSITTFAGEAYNVEMGETNELFPISKTEYAATSQEFDNCNLTEEPTDVTHTLDGSANDPANNFNIPIRLLPAWMKFQVFMRFMDQPKPVAFSASATRGLEQFNAIGCAECHVPSMTTRSGMHGPATVALQGQTVNLFSDILIHHMGATLADNIIQGNAGPDMFRTTPLWGVGQRIFLLHDGRARSLTDAIIAHFSLATPAHGRTPAYPASEANQVVRNFAELPGGSQQDILNFLRSL